MLVRLVALLALGLAAPAWAAAAYRPAGSVALGAPDRWDYVVADASSGRVYVAHGDRLSVIDGRAGTMVGEVTGMPGGSHGIGIVGALGVTDDGKAGEAVVFDPRTLAVLRRVPAGPDADGIAVDAASGRALVVSGDPGTVALIDPRHGTRAAVIAAGEALEYAVAGAPGRAYVAGMGKGDLVAIDTRAGRVIAHWAMPDCAKPHGLAFDAAARRLFLGCVNRKMVVADADDGHVVASLAIGRGSDAVAFDPVRRRIFSANGADGTITVYQQETPDRYRLLDTIPTQASGRTMAVDPTSGRLFVAAATMLARREPARTCATGIGRAADVRSGQLILRQGCLMRSTTQDGHAAAIASKVPAVTLGFWIVKILATTLGETGGDTLSMTMNLGYLVSTAIFAVVLILLVAAQVAAKSFHPFLYWATIIASTTAGTTLADFADRSLGIGYPGGSLLLFACVALSLFVWHRTMGTVAVEAVASRRAEVFYWITITFSQTLGTALGDWVADSGPGFGGGALIFGAMLLAIILAWRFTAISRVALFWAAFILTRPLGATVGDFLDKPIAQGGLDFSRPLATLVLAALILVGILILPQRAGRHPAHG